MSGGTWDYIQYRFTEIIETVKSKLEQAGKPVPDNELWHDREWYIEYPEDKFYTDYSDETKAEFKNAIKYLKMAQVYAQRIDYLFAGDDSEESFHKRLKEDLNEQA